VLAQVVQDVFRRGGIEEVVTGSLQGSL
jgi:hypothetical protein